MDQINEYIHLYSNCRVVKGAQRSVLWNLSSGNFELIPNDLAELIPTLYHTRVLDIYERFGQDSKPILDSYFELITGQDYGFYSNTPATGMDDPGRHFEQWDFPSRVASAIFDFNCSHVDALKLAVCQLATIGCHTLQLRFFNSEPVEVVQDMIAYVSDLKAFHGISIVCDMIAINLPDQTALKLFMRQFPLITEIVLYNAGKHQFIDASKSGYSILYIQQALSENSCGCIGPFYFNRQKTHYAESLQHNTCLNRKISVDQEGNIKNCPSMKSAYGNIYDTSFEANADNTSAKYDLTFKLMVIDYYSGESPFQ
jgi:SPASM domain peptide maturase of grasp-with-spasm system